MVVVLVVCVCCLFVVVCCLLFVVCCLLFVVCCCDCCCCCCCCCSCCWWLCSCCCYCFCWWWCCCCGIDDCDCRSAHIIWHDMLTTLRSLVSCLSDQTSATRHCVAYNNAVASARNSMGCTIAFLHHRFGVSPFKISTKKTCVVTKKETQTGSQNLGPSKRNSMVETK